MLFFLGLWAHQIIFLGTVSFLHMTVGVFLVLLMVAKTKIAWFLCLAYDGILATSIGCEFSSTGMNWGNKASIGEVMVLILGLSAILVLFRPRMLRFVFMNKR